MTTEALQADPRGQHLAELAKALAAVDKWTAQLIIDDLAELLPGLDAAEDQAAAALREDCAALGKPQQQLDDLDAELDRVTGEVSTWSERLTGLDAADRVEARVRFAAWNDELDRVTARRDQADRDLEPYRAARRKAQADLELAQGAKRGVAWAMITPFASRAGQATPSYVGHRQLRLNHVILKGDRDDPEYELAIAELEELCRASGYRTDNLPSIGEIEAARMTAAMADAMTTPPDPAPSMVEQKFLRDAYYANSALEAAAARNTIEDRRGARVQPVPPARERRPQHLRDRW